MVNTDIYTYIERTRMFSEPVGSALAYDRPTGMLCFNIWGQPLLSHNDKLTCIFL